MTHPTRRDVLAAGAAGATALLAHGPARAARPDTRPNVLFLMADQQGLDTLSALGCSDVHTPHLDRLAKRGVAFLESYSSNPLCSPARSSMMTGRPTLETGVIVNGRAIRNTIPNMGQWFRQAGYETVYAGKWHVPISFGPDIPGFDVIDTGINGQGGVCDTAVSRACQGYLRGRRGAARGKPFLLIGSFLQPHDICQFVSMHGKSGEMVFRDALGDALPPLPPNHGFDPREPMALQKRARPDWSETQWRYYLYNYYRMVEMVDAEIGRVLQALDDSGEADNTVVVFTSDHGEGRGRHKLVTKNYLYDEAAKVPLLFAAPGRAGAGHVDRSNLVSTVDILPTVCDLTGVAPPPHVRGNSLAPLLQGKTPQPREFVAAEVAVLGRMIRTPRFKYISYVGDPVEQLFDMQADPGETKNLAGTAGFDADLQAHRRLLAAWEAGLDVAPVDLPPWIKKTMERANQRR